MNNALTRRIERRLEEELGLYLSVEQDGPAIVVTGMVGSESDRDMALRLVSELAMGMTVEDGIEATEVLPGQIGALRIASAGRGSFPGAAEGLEEAGSLEPGDFTDQDYLSDPLAASGAAATGIDEDEVSHGEQVYAAPIDPVGSSREIVGGYELSSMDSVEVERSAVNGFGDEAIAEAVLRELQEDAATTDLDIRVRVRNGVVRISGRVAGIDDADNAAEVASRVPGVREVVDAMDVNAGRMV